MLLEVNDSPGTLLDISRNGMRLSTVLPRTSRHIDIALHADGGTYNVQGMIHWMRQRHGSDKFKEMGVRVHEAPQEYYQFLDGLNWNVGGGFEYGWVLIVLCAMLFFGLMFGVMTFFDLIRF